jgi:glycosyltransferase involved in cell wall biosynthesis
MLSKSELRDLYQTADFGMVASMSNISLVPYEMLSTGLPVIEFTDGTFEYFFHLGSATMTSIDPKDLYEKLKAGITKPETLLQQQERASGYMDTLSWQTSGRQFADILEAL